MIRLQKERTIPPLAASRLSYAQPYKDSMQSAVSQRKRGAPSTRDGKGLGMGMEPLPLCIVVHGYEITTLVLCGAMALEILWHHGFGTTPPVHCVCIVVPWEWNHKLCAHHVAGVLSMAAPSPLGYLFANKVSTRFAVVPWVWSTIRAHEESSPVPNRLFHVLYSTARRLWRRQNSARAP